MFNKTAEQCRSQWLACLYSPGPIIYHQAAKDLEKINKQNYGVHKLDILSKEQYCQTAKRHSEDLMNLGFSCK